MTRSNLPLFLSALLLFVAACSGTGAAVDGEEAASTGEYGAPFGASTVVIQTNESPDLAYDHLMRELQRAGYAAARANARVRTVDTEYQRIRDDLYVALSADVTDETPARIVLHGVYNQDDQEITNVRGEGLEARAWQALMSFAERLDRIGEYQFE